ncbi:MAG: hypothetical protein R3F46_08465 [bacterium]
MQPSHSAENHGKLAAMLAGDGKLPTRESHIENGWLFANGQHWFNYYVGSHASAYLRARDGKARGGNMYLTREYLFFPELDKLVYVPDRKHFLPTTCHLNNDCFLVSDAGGMDIRSDRHPAVIEVHLLNLSSFSWTTTPANLRPLLSDESPLGLVHDLVWDDVSEQLLVLMCRFSRQEQTTKIQRLLLSCKPGKDGFQPREVLEISECDSIDIALLSTGSKRSVLLRSPHDGTIAIHADSNCIPGTFGDYDLGELAIHEDVQITGTDNDKVHLRIGDELWIVNSRGEVRPGSCLRKYIEIIGDDGVKHRIVTEYRD